ncbi:MAG: cation transporter [Ruminococcaceae bacterium]|nr:cation transporter [Oscillospiraceae bacterium]
MTELLCRIFIKNREKLNDPTVRSAYGTLSSAVGIIFNILLAIAKLTAGVLSASVSVTADAVNNLSDAMSQVISLISFKISVKPADRGHPFGHARFEYFASMIVSFIIITISFKLFSSSVEKIISPEPTKLGAMSAAILILSIATKLWISLFNGKIGKRIGSSVVKATALDSLCDAIATSAVLVSMIITHFTGFVTDGYMGVAVSVIIFIAGVKVLLEAKNSILGGAPDPEVIEKIRSIAAEYPEIIGIHDLIVHNYGAGNTIASLHAEVDGSKNIFETHDAIDNLEKRLFSEMSVKATVHLDPIVTDDEKVTALRNSVREAVKRVSPELDIHDFRYVSGSTHSNLIFDVLAPFELKLSDIQLKESISTEISRLDPNYFAVITIDRE